MSESRKIGRYDVLSLLGEGAMGSVFKAMDPFIKRIVAIKTIKLDQSRNEQDAKEFYDRFFQEAQISGTLAHPNIVAIYDVGEDNGTPYIAMEYVEGHTLSEIIHGENPPPLAFLIQIVMQIASALDFAHQHGIVHRDLKPSNIMVMENGTAKIMDFGIAKRSGSNLTQTGVFLGTPSYSSPEQIKEGRVDHRSDIFSFGILTHEVLTGHLTFPGQTINAILYKIANEPPNMAPNLKQLPIDVPSWRQVFTKVLHKVPEKRYQEASTFANATYNALRISSDERQKVGKFIGQFGGTVREGLGIQKDLRRSEFELAQSPHHTHPTTRIPTQKKRRIPALILVFLFLLGASITGGLWYTGQLEPTIDKIKVLVASNFGGPAEEPVVGGAIEKVIAIAAEPEDTQVTIGGNAQGRVPLSYTWKGDVGETLELTFEREGYEPLITSLTLNAQLDPNVKFSLKPLPIARTLTSQPPGARVSIGGEERGATPVDLTMAYGTSYEIRVELDGYVPIVRTYQEGTSKPDNLAFTLRREEPPGTLKVQSLMEDLTIAINGKRQNSPEVSLRAGSYDIEIVSQRYFYRESRRVDVQAGQTATLQTAPIITISKIDFIGDYVRVKIDGAFVKSGNDIDTTPIINLKIAAGTHKFEFFDQGDKMVLQKSLEVNSSEPIVVSANP